ncbi:TetR/AcrR family transcriptional regulator [Salipiger sp. IMCC34102]|uniref:TetR/AcrR family transcriptional regulator n=1 Tax=Salipiger sp. IMCC34102 TaxID=2510647 RepID=UPI0013E9A0C4|nr:TetR/AcrR family transcriptional regulator [Salipiger sp. IMCC34102]
MATASRKPENREGRKTYHHAQLKDALIDTAIRLTAERDGPVFSLRELATALGVSHTAVYRHFADKDALLGQMTRMGFDKLVALQKTCQDRAGAGSVRRLRALCASYVRFATEDPGFFALMFHSRPTSNRAAGERDRHNVEALRVLIDTIRHCQDEGKVIAGDPERIASYLVLAPHGLSSYVAWGHTPGFIARQHDGMADPADWIARVGLEPFLTERMPPEAFSKLFFAADGKPPFA